MISKLLLAGVALVLADGALADSTALLQAHVAQMDAEDGSDEAPTDSSDGADADRPMRDMDQAPPEDGENSEMGQTAGVGLSQFIKQQVGNFKLPKTKEEATALAQEFGMSAVSIGKDKIKDAVRSSLPFHLGSVFVNDVDKEDVKSCADISSPLYCAKSEKAFNVSCAGWGGTTCLERSAECNSITLQPICDNSMKWLKIPCLGWGGSKCLAKGAKAKDITHERICNSANSKLGIKAVGWSGEECLDKKSASCDRITSPAVCNDATKKLGLACAGWGGSFCLTSAAKCSNITSQRICNHAEKLGMECAGWGGNSCLPRMSDNRALCASITGWRICESASKHFPRGGGLNCTWSGNACKLAV